MTTRIADVHIAREERLPPPREVRAQFPVDEAGQAAIAGWRMEVQRILAGRDARLLVVVGPCSIHDLAAAKEYAQRLKSAVPSFDDALFLVMRVYFEKPRTRLGWKGLIYDPDLDGRGNIVRGLQHARELLRDCARIGIPAGSEILDLVTPQFYAELLSWGAIGARTTESPLHRQMASALSAPVGFKNATSGSVKVAVDAIVAAAQSHKFPSISLDGNAIVVTTTGNPHCHLVLRGGDSGPNYAQDSVASASAALAAAGVCPRVMIDCSHGNSGGDHRRQPAVIRDVAAQVAAGSRSVCGVMIESNLVEGRQPIEGGADGLRYGQSVTDACLGWESTLEVLAVLADAVRAGRPHATRGAGGETEHRATGIRTEEGK